MGISIPPSIKAIIGNDYRARRFVHDQPFTHFTMLEFNIVRDPILCPKGSHAFGVSTSLANLPMEFYGKINVNLCKRKMGV